MVACCQRLRGHRAVSKVRASVLRTRNCQTRPKLSYRKAPGEQFSLQVPLERCQRWWRGHRGRQTVPHPSRRHGKSAVADGGEAGEGYGERVRQRRAETPTSVQIGDAMKVTGKVGWFSDRWGTFYSVKLHLKDERTDGRTTKNRLSVRPSVRPSVRSFVRLSLSVMSIRGVHPMGERTAMLHRNLRGDKNPELTN